MPEANCRHSPEVGGMSPMPESMLQFLCSPVDTAARNSTRAVAPTAAAYARGEALQGTDPWDVMVALLCSSGVCLETF